MIVTNEEQLRIQSEPFTGTEEELSNLIKVLEFELELCENPGVGLAAIQIGIPVQVGIIRTEEIGLDLVNTKIVSCSEMVKLREGCLSFPGQFIDVYRMHTITMDNKDGEIMEISGFIAQAVQHEVDHFSGLTMFDRRV